MMEKLQIPYIEGDGTGPDIWRASRFSIRPRNQNLIDRFKIDNHPGEDIPVFSVRYLTGYNSFFQAS